MVDHTFWGQLYRLCSPSSLSSQRVRVPMTSVAQYDSLCLPRRGGAVREHFWGRTGSERLSDLDNQRGCGSVPLGVHLIVKGKSSSAGRSMFRHLLPVHPFFVPAHTVPTTTYAVWVRTVTYYLFGSIWLFRHK